MGNSIGIAHPFPHTARSLPLSALVPNMSHEFFSLSPPLAILLANGSIPHFGWLPFPSLRGKGLGVRGKSSSPTLSQAGERVGDRGVVLNRQTQEYLNIS